MPSKQQQPKRGRGRPPGSPNKRKRQPSRPSSRRPSHRQPTSSATEPTSSAEESVLLTATSSISSGATGEQTIVEKAEHFEVVAATVPDAIGGPAPVAGPSDVIDQGEVVPGEAALEGQVVLDHATVRFYLKFGFEQAARMLKEKRWELSAEELQSATPVTHDMVQKWLPWFLGTNVYKEEIAFAIVMFGIVGPRLHLLKKPMSTAGMGIPDASDSPATAKAT